MSAAMDKLSVPLALDAKAAIEAKYRQLHDMQAALCRACPHPESHWQKTASFSGLPQHHTCGICQAMVN